MWILPGTDKPVGAIALVLLVALGAGAACYASPQACPGGLLCPLGSECAAAQDVCVPVGGCGNGVLDRGEECDDGNIRSADGCSATCRRELAAGGTHTCVVQDGDTARCWGRGSSGQLGHAQRMSVGDNEPALRQGVPLRGPVTVIQVVAGGEHTCVLLASGAVRCWGQGADGQLGYDDTASIGNDESTVTLGDVEVGGLVTQLVAGKEHTCALLDTGAVHCWGKGDNGRLGYGNTDDIGNNETPASVGAVAVGGEVIQLAAGGAHTCALLVTGRVRCWGKGDDGQLGYGNTNDIGNNETPDTAGDVDVGGTVIQLAAGGIHTCALLATGAVRCWGKAEDGQLGYGNEDDIGDDETPAAAGDVPLGDGTVIQLTAGEAHTCALLQTGAVRCWGEGSEGRLGYGARKSTGDVGDNEIPASLGDLRIGGRVTQLVAGGAHTCALLDTGNVRCWGDGDDGRLGYGSNDSVGSDEAPEVVGDVPVGGAVTQITAGDCHTCALLASGMVRCWGNGEEGRLGYGNRTDVGDNETPRQLFGVPQDATFVQLSAGDLHTCALSGVHGVYCWGDGSQGQLGYGTGANIGDDEPAGVVNIRLGGVATQIATGAAHSCALLETGTVRCWGRGAQGQLGSGSAANVGDDEFPDVLGDIEIGGSAVQVVAGAQHTCALLDTGAVRCWGSNARGQLGLGPSSEANIGDDELPAAVGDVRVGGPVLQLAAGGEHTCALLDDRTVRCWGAGDAGQLGYGDNTDIGDDELPDTAGAVPISAAVMQLTAGSAHTCALLATGAVRCWGAGALGQLGYGNTGNVDNAAAAQDIDLGGAALAIAAGSDHTCAMLAVNRYRCWGVGADGRLGYGNTDNIGDDETPARAGDVPF